MKTVNEKLQSLRQVMKNLQVTACIIPGTDPHASEYLATCWKDREWISGFTGSAGTVVVSADGAALWTDSRYFLQAENQLSGTGIQLMKQGLAETPDMVKWISLELKAGQKVAVNSQMFSVNSYQQLKKELRIFGIELISYDFISEIWNDRPKVPQNTFFELDIKYSGITASEKLKNLRQAMKASDTEVFVISALDDIAWLFNIRGNDVEYNPVVISYAMITPDQAVLFVSPEKITADTHTYLQLQGVETQDYMNIYQSLGKIHPSSTVLIDGAKLNQSLFEAIPVSCKVKNQMSPVFQMKCLKNSVETDGIRKAMIKDGVALTRFFKWLEENVNSGELNELNVDDKLLYFRQQQENFMGASFNTIAGYGAHGAIVHYSATSETASELKPEGIFLLDSGGQYLEGTTDITRTISLGKVTQMQKEDFTLVLKGHIALSRVIYPINTRGTQLDILARKAMWERGLNYGHGTGHGVGHFLNVHEGPQSIRMEENPVTLKVGMYMSNEPGLYRAGQHGIRTENLVLVVPAFETEFGQFLQFETMTLCYIDTELIDKQMMDKDEIEWLNNYHNTVFERISPLLNESERIWLMQKCKSI